MMKPEGARYEHEDCGCIFLGTYHEFDLWCFPVDGDRFLSVSSLDDAGDDRGLFCCWAALWAIDDPLYGPLRIAYKLAVQRGLTPLTMVECAAYVNEHAS